MDESKPLSVVVKPKQSGLMAAFTTNARPILSANDRFRVEVIDEGLLIASVWHPDLDVAYEVLQRNGFEGLLWSEPVIHLKREVISGDGGRRREAVLEPFLLVEVDSPPECIGNVIGDLSSRRGLITEQRDLEGGLLMVRCEVPLSELRRYSAGLANLTNGEGRATASFLNYQYAPRLAEPPPDEPKSAALRP